MMGVLCEPECYMYTRFFSSFLVLTGQLMHVDPGLVPMGILQKGRLSSKTDPFQE